MNRTEFSPEVPQHVEILTQLCKDYPIETLPENLIDYCCLIEQAVDMGWVCSKIETNIAIFTFNGKFSIKKLSINLDRKIFMKCTCKTLPWRHRNNFKINDTSAKMQIKKWLDSDVYDSNGNFQKDDWQYNCSEISVLPYPENPKQEEIS